jgi:hypothetical protein
MTFSFGAPTSKINNDNDNNNIIIIYILKKVFCNFLLFATIFQLKIVANDTFSCEPQVAKDFFFFSPLPCDF